MSDESGQTRYRYNDFAQLTEKTQTVGTGTAAKTFTLAYSHGERGSSTGHVTSITYPSGNRIDTAYGDNERIAALMLMGCRR